MSSPHRQIHLAGFLIAGPVVHSHAVWRHPLTTRANVEIVAVEIPARGRGYVVP